MNGRAMAIQILMVDDEPNTRTLVDELLSLIQGQQYVITWTPDFDQGLHALLGGSYDVCLLDYHLNDPLGRSGIEFLRIITQTPNMTPVILLSGHGTMEIDLEAMKIGAADYLDKSQLKPALLERAVRYAIQQAAVLRQLRQSEERYRTIVESMAEGYYELDPSGVIVFGNQVLGELLDRAPDALIGHSLLSCISDDSAQTLAVSLRKAAQKQQMVKAVILQLTRGPGDDRYLETTLWPTSNDGETNGFRGLIRNVTERTSAERLQTIQYFITRTLSEADSVHNAIARILETVCRALSWDFGEYLELVPGQGIMRQVQCWYEPSRGLESFASISQRVYVPGEGLPGRIWQRSETVWLPDITIAHLPRSEAARACGLHSAFGFPILTDETVTGLMVFFSGEIRPPNDDLLQVFAGVNIQIGQFIHRRKLEAAEREQRALAEGLRETASILSSTLDPDEVLDRLMVNIERLVPYESASLMAVEGETAAITRWRSLIPGDDDELVSQSRFNIAQTPGLREMAESGQPACFPDLRLVPGWQNPPTVEWQRSFAGAPIMLEGELVGFLNLTHSQPGFYQRSALMPLQALADQAAIAMQNARLFEQAQTLAAVEERQRLARDLHDSVTQMLFSASVLAETAQRIWQRSPEKVATYLDDLHRLTRGALAEMRTLLIELRPNALAHADLGELLRLLAEAVSGRTQSQLSFEVQGVPFALPADVKTTFYRVAQEAVNNSVKHARATEMALRLTYHPNTLVLEMLDNGAGFDQTQIPSNHFGVSIMHERARDINAHLTLESQPEQGTQIHLRWSTGTDISGGTHA